MKNRILNLAVLLFAWLAASSQLWAQTATPNGSSHENNEFQQLMQKIRQDFATNPPAQEIEEALKTYNETDGSFSDVDYASIQRTLWPPLLHIDRLYDFAFAYTTPGNKYYENEALFDKIVKGLEYWYERNPWCHNWWYNQIAEPQRIGVMLIQLRIGKQQIPAELESKTLERIHKDGGHPAKWTGANRTDIALHWIYRACLSENEADLTLALDNVYNPIVYTTKEGFQHDNCYFQHGQQLYIGGYGDEILKGITQVAMYTQGTRFAIPEEKLALLSKFMRETYYATIRGRHMLFDVLG
ncbi:MAG: chloramphenicol resistance protein, partial [Bacteroides sp.]|nr:chloramphenicol resistance protein [Bacteroides sp.]